MRPYFTDFWSCLRHLFAAVLGIIWCSSSGLAQQLLLQGVNTNDFRVTTFATGLNFPLGMVRLADDSLLVAVADGGNFRTANGEIIRLTDIDQDGVADGPGQVLFSGLSGSPTSLKVAGSLVLVTGSAKPIAILRAGAAPSDPLMLVGLIVLNYPTTWTQHRHSVLGLRNTPGTINSYDVLFQLGATGNFTATTDTVTLSNENIPGAQGVLVGDAVYMLTITDDGVGVSASNLIQVATGLRNAAGITFDPGTGDLYMADNGIDGLVDANEPLSADELNVIRRADIGGSPEFFGFPDNYTEYRSGLFVGGLGVPPVIAFQPLPNPFSGHESEGPNDIVFAPPGFPDGLNAGIFLGFHGKYSLAGINNEENPVIYADPANGSYFHFIPGQQPGIGHLDGLLASRDSLFVADLVTTGNILNGGGAGVIYQIKSLVAPTVSLNFDTVPSGLTLILDGIPRTTPFRFDTVIGFEHFVEAPRQVLGNKVYSFATWDDGGAQSHFIVVPNQGASYSATFISNDDIEVTIVATDGLAAEPVDPGTLTFTRTGPLTEAMTVPIALTGSATSAEDYFSLGTEVEFAAGSATAIKIVTPIDDLLVEGDETVQVTVIAGAEYVVGTPESATVTIADNDAVVTVAATDATAGEPNNTGTFSFSRTGPTTTALTVSISVSGTATSGTDYTSIGTTVVFAAGSATATKTVTPMDNTTAEAPETVTATVAASSGYVVGTPESATVTIADNDAVVTVAATDATAAEPNSTGRFTFSRTGPTTAALTVNISVSGTATSGTDYTSIGTTVVFAAGSATATKTVTPINDSVAEAPETVIARVSASSGYVVGSSASATVTIADNDSVVTVVATDAAAGESSDVGRFTFSRTGPTTSALTVNISVSGTATSSADYASIGTTVAFAAGSATATKTVTPINDSTPENPETVTATVAASSGYVVGSPATATVTIADNDPPVVKVVATDAAAGEPNYTGRFTFSRTGPTTAALAVNFSVSGTATSGTDYTSLGSTVVFATGSSTATKTVTPINDSTTEAPETVIATMVAGSGYVVGSPASATVTITDNDAVVTVAATDSAAGEPNDPGVFTFTRTGPTTAALTVNILVSGTATSGTDYTSIGTAVAFAAGSATATKTVTPINNSTAEAPETVITTVRTSSAYAVGSPNSATLSIADDDVVIGVVATDATASEPNNPGVFTFTRTGPTTAALTVNISVTGTATSGTDYTSIGTSAVFASGSATVTKTVTPIDDSSSEDSETVMATLAASSNYVVGSSASAVVTITDNDTAQ